MRNDLRWRVPVEQLLAERRFVATAPLRLTSGESRYLVSEAESKLLLSLVAIMGIFTSKARTFCSCLKVV